MNEEKTKIFLLKIKEQNLRENFIQQTLPKSKAIPLSLLLLLLHNLVFTNLRAPEMRLQLETKTALPNNQRPETPLLLFVSREKVGK